MPNGDQGTYTPEEFAQQIKSKYPVYAQWPTEHLVREVIQKHPEYQSWVKGYESGAISRPELKPKGELRAEDLPGATPRLLKAVGAKEPSMIWGGLIDPESITRAMTGKTSEQIREITKPRLDETPFGAGARRFLTGTVGDIAGLGSTLTSPGGLGLQALSMGPRAIAAGTGLGLASLGAEQALEPRRPEETAPDVLQRQLYGGAMTAGGLAPAIRGVSPTVAGARLGPGGLREAFEPGRITAARTGLIQALRTPPGRAGGRAETMANDLDTTLPDLAKLQRQYPLKERGAARFGEMADRIFDYRQRLWDEGHTPAVTRHAQEPLDVQPILNRALAEIGAEDLRINPAGSRLAENWARKAFQGGLNLQNGDNMIRRLNQEIKQLPEKYGPIGKRVREAALEALRDQLDSQLVASGEQGVLDVNRRWGALRNIENRLRERAPGLEQAELRKPFFPDWMHLYAFLHPAGGVAWGLGLRGLGRAFQPSEGTVLGTAMRRLGRTSLGPEDIIPPQIPAVTPPQTPATRLPPQLPARTGGTNIIPGGGGVIQAGPPRPIIAGQLPPGVRGLLPPAPQELRGIPETYSPSRYREGPGVFRTPLGAIRGTPSPFENLKRLPPAGEPEEVGFLRGGGQTPIPRIPGLGNIGTWEEASRRPLSELFKLGTTKQAKPQTALERSIAARPLEGPRPIAKYKPSPIANPEDVFDANTLKSARAELAFASDFLSQMERPGRFKVFFGQDDPNAPPARVQDHLWYGIRSMRNQFPWFEHMSETPKQLLEAVARGKGAVYNRLLTAAARFWKGRAPDWGAEGTEP